MPLPVVTVLREIEKEYNRAAALYRPMNTPHEAYAVIKEEFDEFWDEVKRKNPDLPKMRSQLIQVAAMAVRTIHDCC